MIDCILRSMRSEIEKHGLELLQRYPSDLLVHDKAVLSWSAVPGMEIAWMCGDSHTHIVPLGLHDDETDMVSALLNLSSRDRFYTIKVRKEGFALNEVTRETFGNLTKYPSKYIFDGHKRGFWLMRRDHSKVGTIEIVSEGGVQNIVHRARISPIAGISRMDEAALNVWCSHSIRRVAGTLFCKSEMTWADPIQLAA